MQDYSALRLIDAEAQSDPGSPSALLRNISLHISQGEWIGIAGPNGSGKSTLAKVLAGIHPLSKGRIDRGFAGEKLIPIVMQHTDQLFGTTPLEELVFVLETSGAAAGTIAGKAEAMLAEVGLAESMHHPIEQLSGGQRQLVAAASALALDAPMLIFDEPTSMLDAASRRLLLRLAARLHKRGMTIVWLTHHEEEIAHADRVIVLENGEIRYDGASVNFFYDGHGEKFGFELPFAVQVGQALLDRGVQLPFLPMTAEQLAEAAGQWADGGVQHA